MNTIGGSFSIRRVELSIDTRLGTREIASVYDSHSAEWLWNFDVRYDGESFLDPSGATHDVAAIADGEAIPGTHWVKLDADRIRTKGGVVWTFDAEGRLDVEHWSDGSYPQLRYVSADVGGMTRTVRIDQCTAVSSCIPFFDLGYDAAARLTSIADHTGRQATFAWSPAGQLVNARDGLDVAESRPGFTYEYAGGQLAAVTSSDGERTEIAAAGGRAVEVRLVGNPDAVHAFSYQGKSDGLYHTRYFPAAGGERRFAFDESRRLAEVLFVESGDRTSIAWSGLRPTQRIEPDGSVRAWTWLDDDIHVETEPSGNVIQYTYAPAATNREDASRRPVLQILDSMGLVELRAYDAAGRLTSRANGAGESTGFTYDAEGHLASRTDPDGVVTNFSGYGEHGHADVVTIDGFDLLSEWDAVGNLVRGTGGSGPEAGGVVSRAYDADRNLRTLEMKTGTIEIDVRADGQQTYIAREGGDDHEMNYDAFGRLIERREFADGSWHSTFFSYDAMGRETAVGRPNGMRRETVYDEDGRPVLVRALRHGVLEGTQTLTWANGLLVSSADTMGNRVEQFAYDPAGRMSAVTHGDGSFTVFGYDLRSRRTSELHVEADFQVVADLSRAYDGADREVEVREGGSMLVERQYDEGRIAEIRYGNGLTREFEYQLDIGGLVSSTTRDAGGSVVESTILTRLGFGLDFVAAQTQTFGGVEASTEEAFYLAPSPGPHAAGPQLVGIGEIGNYFLDAKSNLLESPSGSLTYNAEGNRLLHAEGVGSYQYDEAGFVTQRAGIPITWTAHGRLASHGLDELAWDMSGRLVSSTVAGVTLQRRFGGAIQADAYGIPMSMDLGDVRVDLLAGQHQYRHFDFRGNVKFTTDQAGAVRSHYQYDGYGVVAVHGASDDPLRFVGRAEFGDLMILGERIYDPAAGRFLSPDPIFQLVNQFSYTLGNPVWFSDPDGTHPTGGSKAAEFLGGLGDASAGISVFSAIIGNATFAVTFGAIAVVLYIAARIAQNSPALRVEAAGGFGGLNARASVAVDSGGGAPSTCSPSPGFFRSPVSESVWKGLFLINALLGASLFRRRRQDG